MPSPDLPPEIWAQIAQGLDTKSIKVLSLISRNANGEARRRLYHSVRYRQGRRFSLLSKYDNWTRTVDLALFFQCLTNWPGWRGIVQNVRLEWSNDDNEAYDEPANGPETRDQSERNDLIKNTANLLSESKKLRSLHLSIPRMDSSIPFEIRRMDSLQIPITCGLYHDGDPGYATLLKLFQIPSLGRVEIHSMVRLYKVVPDSCRQPWSSNVRELSFLECGPISEELIDLLRWPKNLQTLNFDVTYHDNSRAWVPQNTGVHSGKTIDTLMPFRHSIEALQISIYEMDGIPYQKNAFTSFSKLRSLRVTYEMFMRWADTWCEDTHIDHAPPIHTQLPRGLQVLTIEMNDSSLLNGWKEWSQEDLILRKTYDEIPDQPSDYAIEFLALLSGLAEHKASCFPELRELHVENDWIRPDETPEKNPYNFPSDCDNTRQFIRLMTESDIAVFFNRFRWS